MGLKERSKVGRFPEKTNDNEGVKRDQKENGPSTNRNVPRTDVNTWKKKTRHPKIAGAQDLTEEPSRRERR